MSIFAHAGRLLSFMERGLAAAAAAATGLIVVAISLIQLMVQTDTESRLKETGHRTTATVVSCVGCQPNASPSVLEIAYSVNGQARFAELSRTTPNLAGRSLVAGHELEIVYSEGSEPQVWVLANDESRGTWITVSVRGLVVAGVGLGFFLWHRRMQRPQRGDSSDV